MKKNLILGLAVCLSLFSCQSGSNSSEKEDILWEAEKEIFTKGKDIEVEKINKSIER